MKNFWIIILVILMAGCGKAGGTQQTPASAEVVVSTDKHVFSGDSAYAFVAQQCAFGPRVTGSDASRECAQWLVNKLKEYGAADLQEQKAELKAYDGTVLNATNISARFNPEAQERMLVMAHWDSRPWADQDPNNANRRKAIDGANDGASGVGVILELARLMSIKQPKIGVDVLLVDAEDYGPHAEDKHSDDDSEAWALGTQYWVENPTFPLTDIKYGILLDMVGGKDATFSREYHSEYAAKPVNDRVWAAARRAGAGKRFVDTLGGAVVDDHVYLLIAGVPVIDIIEGAHPDTGSFPPYWHTMHDTIENIDPATLQDVGNTLMQLIY